MSCDRRRLDAVVQLGSNTQRAAADVQRQPAPAFQRRQESPLRLAQLILW